MQPTAALRLLAALAVLAPLAARASIPEPDLVFYGRVHQAGTPQPGRLRASPASVSSGQLVWTITPAGGAPRQFTAQLRPLGDSGFTYRLAIPVEFLTPGASADPAKLQAAATPRSHGRATITLGGAPAFITHPDAPLRATFTFGVADRGRLERVDLALAPNPASADILNDHDGDGLPDHIVEQHAGLGPGFPPGQPPAAGDLDGDSRTNLDEYLDGTDLYGLTYADWARLHVLSGPAADYAADPDGDGHRNLEEFALGGHPLRADTAFHRQRVRLLPAPGGGAHQDFIVAKPFPAAPRRVGVAYLVKHSLNLLSWQDLTTQAEQDDTTLALLADETRPAPSRQFFRLQIDVVPAP